LINHSSYPCYIFVLLTFLLTRLSVDAQTDGLVIDKIAAQVGDNVILLSDIENQKQQAIASGVNINPYISCDILEQLMFKELLVNQAKLDSLVISDDQVDAEMENRIRVIENQIGSRQEMEKFYGKTVNEIKNEFREAIKDKLLADEMERNITKDNSVTPKEVQDFYATIPEDSIPLINSQLSFQQIVYYPGITKEDKQLAYEKLAEIRKNILAGKSFETQARIHSMDPGSAADGGKIEASRGMMVPPFEAAVFSLTPGEISDIFETTYGYHIVKLVSRKGDDYICKHILISAEFSAIALSKAAALMDSCYAKLNSKQLTWDEAVLKYSNDDATMQNKGIITNPITGEQTWDMEDLNQVDQQIFLITDAMEKGDISQPSLYMNIFDRKQGIRIVRLMNRTQPHKANLKQDYALIKRAAENDKKQRTINNWIKGKINNAYIRIDDEFKNCAFRNNWAKNE
jgi:peptidyl-prolyl cis-trans isomerase SurA